MDQRDTFELIDRRQSEGSVRAVERRTTDLRRPPFTPLSHLGLALLLMRKIAVATAGGALLILGVALIVLPGPAIIVIPLGLAVLATEFPWAARLLRYLKERAAQVLERVRRALPRRTHTPVR